MTIHINQDVPWDAPTCSIFVLSGWSPGSWLRWVTIGIIYTEVTEPYYTIDDRTECKVQKKIIHAELCVVLEGKVTDMTMSAELSLLRWMIVEPELWSEYQHILSVLVIVTSVHCLFHLQFGSVVFKYVFNQPNYVFLEVFAGDYAPVYRGVVTLIKPVEPFATGIKMKSRYQNFYWY